MGRFGKARPCCSRINAPVHSFASGEGDGEGGELSAATRTSSTMSVIVRRWSVRGEVWCFEKREQQAQLTSGRGTDSAQPDQQKHPDFFRILISTDVHVHKIINDNAPSPSFLPSSLVCNRQHVHQTRLKNGLRQDTGNRLSACVESGPVLTDPRLPQRTLSGPR